MEQTTPGMKSISVNFIITPLVIPINLSLYSSFLPSLAHVLSFRFALSAVDMEEKDYDSRTGLHVASAEGEPTYFSGIILFSHITCASPYYSEL